MIPFATAKGIINFWGTLWKAIVVVRVFHVRDGKVNKYRQMHLCKTLNIAVFNKSNINFT